MSDLTTSTRAAYLARKKPTFNPTAKLDTNQVADQRKFTSTHELKATSDGGLDWYGKTPPSTRSPAPTGSTPDKVAYAKNRRRMNETARLKRTSDAAEDLAFGGSFIGQSIPRPPKRKP